MLFFLNYRSVLTQSRRHRPRQRRHPRGRRRRHPQLLQRPRGPPVPVADTLPQHLHRRRGHLRREGQDRLEGHRPQL